MRFTSILLLLAALLATLSTAHLVRYDGHKIVRVATSDETIHQWFFDSFDVLEARRGSFELRLSPEQFLLVKALGLQVEVLEENVQRLLEIETAPRTAARNLSFFEDYHTYDETKAWYQQLAKENAGTTFISSIGKSHQGRDIFVFTFGTAGKPAFYLQSLQHAREWISGATLNYVVWYFLTQDTSFLSKYEFIVVPIVNPDGYVYSWSTDRLWRKNRRNNGGSYGVDLNRNWNSHWGQGGSSSVPSSDTYMGPSVASEPEVQAISKYFLTKKNIIAGFDIHCYSQLLLRPYGWKNGDAEHEDELFEAAADMVSRIKATHGKTYDNIHSIELYITTGTTSDWFYDDEVKNAFGSRIYGYTFELRPATAIPGFQLPPDEIIPTGEEIVAAFEGFFDFAFANPLN